MGSLEEWAWRPLILVSPKLPAEHRAGTQKRCPELNGSVLGEASKQREGITAVSRETEAGSVGDPAVPTPLPCTTHLVLTENNHPKGIKNCNFQLAKQRVIHPAVTSGNLQKGRRSRLFHPKYLCTPRARPKDGHKEESKNIPGTFPGREAKT